MEPNSLELFQILVLMDKEGEHLISIDSEDMLDITWEYGELPLQVLINLSLFDKLMEF